MTRLGAPSSSSLSSSPSGSPSGPGGGGGGASASATGSSDGDGSGGGDSERSGVREPKEPNNKLSSTDPAVRRLKLSHQLLTEPSSSFKPPSSSSPTWSCSPSSLAPPSPATDSSSARAAQAKCHADGLRLFFLGSHTRNNEPASPCSACTAQFAGMNGSCTILVTLSSK